MKICPKCSKTYDDETLNFCLDDGSVLSQAQIPSPAEPPPTVMMPAVPPVTEHQSQAAPTEQTFEVAPRYEPSSGGGSRSWIWAILILFAVVILCGGGFVGLLLVSSLDTDDDPFTQPTAVPRTDELKRAPRDSRRLRQSDDMSNWAPTLQKFDRLESRYRRGELLVNTKKRFFYVITAGNDFKTYDASVKIKVRNTTGAPVTFGYGLVVHSDPTRVLSRDYAFVIRSDNRQYRVIRHTNQKETNLVGWTNSKAIRSGTRSNVLEVRIDGNEMKFYVNGYFVRSVKDFTNFKRGIAGIYTSDDVPIAFSNLELRK